MSENEEEEKQTNEEQDFEEKDLSDFTENDNQNFGDQQQQQMGSRRKATEPSKTAQQISATLAQVTSQIIPEENRKEYIEFYFNINCPVLDMIGIEELMKSTDLTELPPLAKGGIVLAGIALPAVAGTMMFGKKQPKKPKNKNNKKEDQDQEEGED